MTFDLGQGAFQGARKTLKYDHTVAVTTCMHGDAANAFWTSYCLWVLCIVSDSTSLGWVNGYEDARGS